jgi:hypothetical protein
MITIALTDGTFLRLADVSMDDLAGGLRQHAEVSPAVPVQFLGFDGLVVNFDKVLWVREGYRS